MSRSIDIRHLRELGEAIGVEPAYLLKLWVVASGHDYASVRSSLCSGTPSSLIECLIWGISAEYLRTFDGDYADVDI